MIRPDDDDSPFVARWNSLVRVLLVESSVKLVARTAGDYANFVDGSSCFPSNERLARDTGYSKRTVVTAWGTLRGLKMAQRVGRGVPHERIADEYELVIPDAWTALPILGPSGRPFTCLYCGKKFNPAGNSTLNAHDRVTFDVIAFCFCPKPRGKSGRDEEWCFPLWDAEQKRAGEPDWRQMQTQGATWNLFRTARGEAW